MGELLFLPQGRVPGNSLAGKAALPITERKGLMGLDDLLRLFSSSFAGDMEFRQLFRGVEKEVEALLESKGRARKLLLKAMKEEDAGARGETLAALADFGAKLKDTDEREQILRIDLENLMAALLTAYASHWSDRFSEYVENEGKGGLGEEKMAGYNAVREKFSQIVGELLQAPTFAEKYVVYREFLDFMQDVCLREFTELPEKALEKGMEAWNELSALKLEKKRGY